jgi:hypothetical protein
MSYLYRRARLKIGRAYHHLNILEEQVGSFFKTDPYTIITRFNADRTECRFNISVSDRIPQDEWGLIVGDCVHNVRSALDHLVWEIAESFSGHQPTDSDTQFPIFRTRDAFCTSCERYIGRLPVYAQALIEQLQPYHASCPSEHPLWLCRHLDNDDKHKIIPVVAAVVQSGAISLPPHICMVEQRFRFGQFEDGAEVGLFRFADPVPPEAQMNPQFSFVETITERPPYIDARHILRKILYFVARSVDVFEQFPDHREALPVWA